MRRQFFLASAGALALTGPALAADLAPPPPAYLPPPPIFTFTGLYVGAQVGYAWAHDSANVFVPALPGGFDYSIQPKGVIGGFHVGYNLQYNQWLLGAEGTVDGTSLRGTTGLFTPLFAASVSSREIVQGSIRLRAGYVWNRLLIYATGGAAFSGIHNGYDAVSAIDFGLDQTIDRTRAGWTVGGGLEYAITPLWSVRAEYRYSDFGHFTDFPFAGLTTNPTLYTVTSGHHVTENQVQAGVSYKLDLTPPAPPVVAKY